MNVIASEVLPYVEGQEAEVTPLSETVLELIGGGQAVVNTI